MSNQKKIYAGAAIAAFVAFSIPATVVAQFSIPSGVPGLSGGNSAQQTTSPQQLQGDLNGLSKKFATSFQAMLMAESHTASALGLKSEAEKLETTAKYYSKGTVDDYDQVKRDIAVSENAQSEISKSMGGASNLDTAAKGELGKAVPFYASGTVQAAGLPSEYSSFVSRAQGTMKSPAAMASAGGLATQLPKVVGVTSQLPDLMSKWGALTKTFVTFSQKQKVDTGDLSSKIGNL